MKKPVRRKPARVARATSLEKKMALSKPLKRKGVLVNVRRRGSVALPAKASRARQREVVPVPNPDPRARLAVEQYEAAVRLLQQHKFERAKLLFEKAMAGPTQELTDRARVHLNICEQRLRRQSVPIRTPEDHYNVAVAFINSGRLEEAEQHLNRTLKLTPRADHVYYALSAVQSLRGDIEGALENLRTAIDLEPRNRYLARNDRDFTALTEDPRFADLVYPESNVI